MGWCLKPGVCAPLFEPVLLREGAKVRRDGDSGAPELCHPRRAYLCLNVPGTIPLQSHQDCAHNEWRSLMTRVLREVPTPVESSLDQLRQAADSIAHQLRPVTALEGEDLIKVFPKHKQKSYRKAYEELLTQGPPQKKDSMIKAFVKHEKLRLEEKEGDPRMIQFRSMKFNLMYGGFTRAVEKQLYDLKIAGKKCVFKGLNERQRATLLREFWDEFEQPRALLMDASRWDMHCSKEFLRATLHRLLKHLGADVVTRTMMKQTLENTGFTAGGHWYKLSGSVMSGDMTTALGNCVGMLCCVMALARRLGILEIIRIFCDGDDTGIIGPKWAVELFQRHAQAWFTSVGHTIKLEEMIDEFEQIEFCQHHPVWAAGAWRMMPNPMKTVSSSLMIPKGQIWKAEEYLLQVWWARAILHQGMPILGPLFSRLATQLGPRPKEWDVSLYQGLFGEKMGRETRPNVFVHHVEDETRVAVERIWGISIDQQYEYEALEVPDIPRFVECHRLIQPKSGEMIVLKDTVDLATQAPGWVGHVKKLRRSS